MFLENYKAPHDLRMNQWTNAKILLIGPLGTNFSEILIEIITFVFKIMCLKVSSAKWWPCCLGLNVLIQPRLSCGRPYITVIHGNSYIILYVNTTDIVLSRQTHQSAVGCDKSLKWTIIQMANCGDKTLRPVQFTHSFLKNVAIISNVILMGDILALAVGFTSCGCIDFIVNASTTIQVKAWCH